MSVRKRKNVLYLRNWIRSGVNKVGDLQFINGKVNEARGQKYWLPGCPGNLIFKSGNFKLTVQCPSGNWAKNGNNYMQDKSTILFLFSYKKSIANAKKNL